jgi:hypothetical protein
LVELCLKNGVNAAQYDGQVIQDDEQDWFVDMDRVERAQQCLDYVYRRHKELSELYPGHDIKIESESRSNPGGMFGRDDWWGTVDITITVRRPMTGEALFIEVCDYKDGRGYVSEKNNSQLISYLAGKMRPFIASGPELVRPFRPDRLQGCRVSIVQPKTNPSVRYQDLEPITVIEEVEKLSRAAAATDKPDAPLIPGKHCQWCKANPKRGGHCTAKSENSIATVETMSELSTSNGMELFEQAKGIINNPEQLTSEELASLADAKAGMEAVFEAVEKEITKRIEEGNTVPGYALVPKRGTKVWNSDEDDIAKMLKSRRMTKDEIYPRKLVSPAQALKCSKLTAQQRQRIEDEYISMKSSGMKLAKATREEKSVESMFNDVAQSNTNDVNLISTVEASPVEEQISFI